ncbi:aspartate kinase [Halodesulfurarchaeum sp.]|uniref:aspartate kinase n=1 Tax=Halodesulfurarchaeum sp. TaxID=1980530 RepID=UPI002FC2BA02
MRVVTKFGGTSLGSGERIDRAADSIAKVADAGHEIAVVASAMGDRTDDLLDAIEFDATDRDEAEIVSMGERTSVRLLKAALTAQDIDSVFLEPGDSGWPIVTNDIGEVLPEETRKRSKKLADKLGETVPILTGFLAQDLDGNMTTLGRGGSDTTAVMLGQYMTADQVVIVTDVEGVMTGDPNVVEGAQNVGEITVDELRNLSFRGAEVVAPSALSYKDEDLTVRVIHYQHRNILSGGTTIEGQFEHMVDMREDPLSCLTVAGRAIRNTPGILHTLSGALYDAGINVDAVASGMDSITVYVDESVAETAETVLHDKIIKNNTLSSVTVTDKIAVIRVLGTEFPDQPGVVAGIVDPLADAHINLVDVITSATSVAAFVPWENREAALEIIQDAF